MSSAISTETARGVRPAEGQRSGPPAARPQSLQPWQFFVLAALLCATIATFLLRVNGVIGSVLMTALMGAAALVGMAGLRTLRPLFSADPERAAAVSERVRETLERDKMLALRTIKELEFDRAMGKLSAEDFQEMSGRLRARAARIMRQLDASSGYRERIERDVAARAGSAPAGREARPADAGAACAGCGTRNDADARFCKNCGNKL